MIIDDVAERNDLTRRASRLLAAGEPIRALRLAERLCRSYQRPDARHVLLRAQAALDLDDLASAKFDFRRALEIDPTDVTVAETILRMARVADPAACRSAALALLASPRFSFSRHAAAIDILQTRSTPVVAQVRLADGRLEGWATWSHADRLRGRLPHESSHFDFTLKAEPRHPLASASRSAANFSQVVPSGAIPKLDWYLDRASAPAKAWSHLVYSAPGGTLHFSLAHSEPTGVPGRACCVIVPLYDDPDATEQCLESLSRQSFDGSMRIIMILDRPNNADMLGVAKRATDHHGFELLINAANFGFVETVKRGLAATRAGEDILLLNADTLLPDDAVQRLCRAAHSRPEIGTVTPFSNNGEVTSLPKPFTVHAVGGIDCVRHIDAVARQVNDDGIVTIPNGIGFCLYVKRSCFDAIGAFPDVYQRGYYEDVELCLRARERGFVNVCATNVYVGHVGSRSFKAEKKALVALNAKILKSRFPDFLSEGLALLRQDPLRSSREAIAWALPSCPPGCRLIVASAPTFALTHRTKNLRKSGKPVLTLVGTKSWDRHRVSLSSIGFDLHHDTRIDLADPNERAGLIDHLRALDIARVEIIDQPIFEPAFFARLAECFPCRPLLDCAPDDRRLDEFRRPESANCIRPLALNTMVSGVLAHHGIAHDVQRKIKARETSFWTGDALGILYPEAHAAGDALLRRIAAKRPRLAIVILGRTFSDAAFMSHPNIVVIGAAEQDYLSVIDRCRVSALFSPDRAGGFALMDWLSRTTGRPAAHFDWSRGKMVERDGDLSLDPALVDDEAVDRLLVWCETRRIATERSHRERGEVVDVIH